jgi:hypothetical protein
MNYVLNFVLIYFWDFHVLLRCSMIFIDVSFAETMVFPWLSTHQVSSIPSKQEVKEPGMAAMGRPWVLRYPNVGCCSMGKPWENLVL